MKPKCNIMDCVGIAVGEFVMFNDINFLNDSTERSIASYKYCHRHFIRRIDYIGDINYTNFANTIISVTVIPERKE